MWRGAQGSRRWVTAAAGDRIGPVTPSEGRQYVCAGSADNTLEQLIAVAGGRWRIEECFQAAKNEAGLASYQVRDYTAWYRHITLAMLALAVVVGPRGRVGQGGEGGDEQRSVELLVAAAWRSFAADGDAPAAGDRGQAGVGAPGARSWGRRCRRRPRAGGGLRS